MERPVVALVEDDSATITVMTDLLTDEGFQTFHWRQGRGAFDLIKEQQPNAIILDIRLEHQRAGTEVLDMLRGDPATRGIPVIICTGDEEYIEKNAGRLRTQPAMVVIDIEEADRRVAWIALNRLQRDAETRAIPILLCSTDAPFLASQAGRYLVMQKPLEPRILLKTIEATVGPPPPRPVPKRRDRAR